MIDLESKALALRVINCTKHKAAGRTHRAEIQLFTQAGKYVRTVVFYLTAEDEAGAQRRAINHALKSGTKSISNTLQTLKIIAL